MLQFCPRARERRVTQRYEHKGFASTLFWFSCVFAILHACLADYTCKDGFAFLNSTFPDLLVQTKPFWRVLGCFEIRPEKPPTAQYLVPHDSHSHYRNVFLKFLTEMHARDVFGLGGSFFWRADDDSSLPPEVELALFLRKQPVVTHARFLCPDEKHVVFVPDPHFLQSYGFRSVLSRLKASPSWPERQPNIFWRGSTTGYPLSRGCHTVPRISMCKMALHAPWLDAKISAIVQWCKGNKNYLPGLNLTAPAVPEEMWSKHRGILDIDGNVNAWGLFWRLGSGSTVFRIESPYCNMYTRLLQPYVHYIPIKQDLSDFINATRIIQSKHEPDIVMLEEIAYRSQELVRSLSFNVQVSYFVKGLCEIWGTCHQYSMTKNMYFTSHKIDTVTLLLILIAGYITVVGIFLCKKVKVGNW